MARVSRGSKMDQIYIPKNRVGLGVGDYVEIKPIGANLQDEERERKLYFYKIKYLEPIKLDIINRVIEIIDEEIKNDNIIIAGSFLDKGFEFADLDIVVLCNANIDDKHIDEVLEKKIGIKTHVVIINNSALIVGLSSDPLYQMMLSKCVAKNRFIYRIKKKIDYKILDLHLLKSKVLMQNYDVLNGREKYYFTRNMVAIYLFLHSKRIDREKVEKEIKDIFNLNDIDGIRLNMLDKESFLKRYKEIYNKTFDKIMENIKDGAK